MDYERLLVAAGPFVLPALGVSAFIEYVFPPFPGDTVVVVGACLAVRGHMSPWLLILATTVGSIGGSWVDYLFGVWLGQRLDHPSSERWRRILNPERLAKLEASYRRWGRWLILSNRFIPFSRAIFFVFAGMSGLPVGETVALGTVSAIAWYGLLVGLGFAVGANFDRLFAIVQQIGLAMTLGLVAVGVVVGLIVWLRRRRAPPG
jgi:membrane protein DedA with SNARE-associated domain